jgi:hypothetical protein
MGNIKFENFPVTPEQFDILEIESWETRNSFGEGALQGALSFWGLARQRAA